MKYKLLAVAVSSVLGLAACGGSDGNSSGKVEPGTSTVNFAGTVNKGIISNGKVEICDTFDAQGCRTGVGYYQETTTNASGQYSIQGAPLNKPILVAVSKKGSATTMKCDVEQCTDANGKDVGFGQSFVVADGWRLQSILPAANTATEVVNVTSLTDIAAKQALEDAGSAAVTTEGANAAKEVVETVFGLEGSIMELGAVDLTDASQTETASADEINAALYSAAVMSSQVDTDALIQNNGGVYRVLPTALEIMDAANRLVNSEQGTPLVKVSAQSQKKLADHEAVMTSGVNGFKDKDNDGKPDAIEITPQQPIEDPIAAAKGFIQDVRTTYYSVQDAGDLKAGLQDFANELEAVAPLAESDAQQAVFNVQQAVEAIAAKHVDQQDDMPQEIDVNVETTDAGTLYTATMKADNPGSVTVLALVKQFEEGGENTPTNIDLEIREIHSQYQSVTLSGQGLAKIVNTTFTETETTTTANPDSYWAEGRLLTLMGDKVSLQLRDVSLAVQGDGRQPAEFTGQVLLNVEKPVAYIMESSERDGSDVTETERQLAQFTYANIRFSGDITTGADSLGVYLNLIADNKREYLHSKWSEMSFSCDYYNGYSFNCSHKLTDSSEAESAEKFVETYFTAQVTTNVNNALNNNVAAAVKLEVDRAQFNMANAKVTVHYNDADTIIEAPLGLYGHQVEPSVTVRNTVGVMAQLTNLETKIQGKLLVNGEKVASIEELDSGLVLVRFKDGHFETIF